MGYGWIGWIRMDGRMEVGMYVCRKVDRKVCIYQVMPLEK